MSKSAVSIFAFAVYLFVLGAVLLIDPNFLLSIFSIPETSEVWIRVVGMLVTILGFYYLQASRNELTAWFRATVYGRSAVLVFFIVFVLLDYAPAVLILFGAIDAAGALWTALCLRAERAA